MVKMTLRRRNIFSTAAEARQVQAQIITLKSLSTQYRVLVSLTFLFSGKYFKAKDLWKTWDPVAFEGFIQGGLRYTQLNGDLHGMVLTCDPVVEAAIFGSCYPDARWAALKSGVIRCPVRLFTGQDSTFLLNGSYYEDALNALPDVQFSSVPGTHMSPMEHCTRWAMEVARIIGGTHHLVQLPRL